jgi:hypothetical protein
MLCSSWQTRSAPQDITAEDVQSCVENFRVDDDMILKVRDIVSVARRKLVPRGCALMTPRVAVSAVWVPAWLCAWGGRAGRLAACARAFHVRASYARAARSRSSSLQVCGACSRRDPAKTYSECVLGDTSPARMLVSPRGLAQLNAEGGVEFLDNEGNTVSSNTSLLRHFVEFHGRTYNCHPDAVDLDRSLRLVLGLRPRWSAHTGACAHSRSAPPLRAYYCCDAPEGSIAAGDDIGTLEALQELSVATE